MRRAENRITKPQTLVCPCKHKFRWRARTRHHKRFCDLVLHLWGHHHGLDAPLTHHTAEALLATRYQREAPK